MTWRQYLCAEVVVDIGGSKGKRVRPAPELVLHVCCTQADLIMFHSR
jgi:hypothetical protein